MKGEEGEGANARRKFYSPSHIGERTDGSPLKVLCLDSCIQGKWHIHLKTKNITPVLYQTTRDTHQDNNHKIKKRHHSITFTSSTQLKGRRGGLLIYYTPQRRHKIKLYSNPLDFFETSQFYYKIATRI